MNTRTKKLRTESLNTVPELSLERAQLVTEAYKKFQGTVSTPVLRAKVFNHLMENQSIFINADELIIGEKGPGVKIIPIYPELCSYTAEDLDLVDKREKVFYRVSEETKKTYLEEILPFWENKSMNNMLFKQMNDKWHDCYKAVVFTEFMEQKSPGAGVADQKLFTKGFNDFIKDIECELEKISVLTDMDAYNKREELKAMLICAKAIIRFAERHSDLAYEMSLKENDQKRKSELLRISEICKKVPAKAPENMWEALQSYWFVHLGVTIESNTWDAYSPGRLDQHLYPFYENDTKVGSITPEGAKELLECFWIKFNNQPSPPKVGTTLEESCTYADLLNINLGGLTPDGTDAVNELSYMMLDVIKDIAMVQPSSSVLLSKKNPESFLTKTGEVIRKGYGLPSIFNADAIIDELIRHGVSLEDARNGGISGCVETTTFGKEAVISTGYFNLVKALEITLHNGLDPRTGKVVGLQTGDPKDFTTFNELIRAFKKQVDYFIDIKIEGNNLNERLHASFIPEPFLSITIDDCIKTGKDYNDGGARYNTQYISGVGIGTITNSLSAIKYCVFDNKQISMEELIYALDNNFDGYEKIKSFIINKVPKLGNDDDYADDIMNEIFSIFFDSVDGRKHTKNGKYAINMLPTTSHVYFGSVIGATPDGRLSGKPLSEGISPVQGTDKNGPTAVIKSMAKMDHLKTVGTLLNQKLTPDLLKDDDGIKNMGHLVRAYFKLDGHHLQFNVINADTLRSAQSNPDDHKNLIVRVAGYSDYFCDLNTDLQDEIISRTEQDNF